MELFKFCFKLKSLKFYLVTLILIITFIDNSFLINCQSINESKSNFFKRFNLKTTKDDEQRFKLNNNNHFVEADNFIPIDLKSKSILNDYQSRSNGPEKNQLKKIQSNKLVRRLEMLPWSRWKDGRLFVLLNNQMVPAETITNALIRNNLNNYPTREMLDFKLIQKLNSNSNNNHHQYEPTAISMENYQNDHFDGTFNQLDEPVFQNKQDKSAFVERMATNFNRFPFNSQRFRLAKLGTIGYGNILN